VFCVSDTTRQGEKVKTHTHTHTHSSGDTHYQFSRLYIQKLEKKKLLKKIINAKVTGWRWLYCVAVCDIEVQYIAACCSVLQCVAVCCSVLQCIADTTREGQNIEINHQILTVSFQNPTDKKPKEFMRISAKETGWCSVCCVLQRVAVCCSVLVLSVL